MKILAIDGPAGAGKTTLAAKLEAQYSLTSTVQVIHMDDLYDGWENALNQSLTENLYKIIASHLNGQGISIRRYNWARMDFDQEITLDPTDLLILEGVGAAQRIVREAGAITYWLEIDPETGLKRVLERDGVEIQDQMRSWQIQQEKHFALDQTRQMCELKLT